jgi:two-component system alkaline phosphatase synthesis response regulator PhoP
MKRILVVDDEEVLCEILKFNLRNASYEVDVANSAEEAFSKLKNSYDLILLDVLMEGITGFKFAELIRAEYGITIPIIFITSKDSEKDMLTGFELGADDYIVKPFSIKEVLARIRAVLNRAGIRAGELNEKQENPASIKKKKNSSAEKVVYKFGTLIVDQITKTASVEKVPVKMTKKEFEILCMLSSEPKKVFPRKIILEKVWRNETLVIERTVDVHIARLRKKLGRYGNCIVNKSGFGYSFNPEKEKF